MLPSLLSINQTFETTRYETYRKTGLARGVSSKIIPIEYLLQTDVSWRLPALTTYRAVSDTFIYYSQKYDQNSSWSNITSKNSNNTLVLGIGESLRADNLSIYGYGRDTTPNLSNNLDNMTLFKNVYSAGTNTWNSLPSTLTKAGIIPDFSKSIIHLANNAGYKTYWISNHGKGSEFDFSVSTIAAQADQQIFFSIEDGGEVYDSELIPYLSSILSEKSEEKKLIVLHFFGSHMHFPNRYPEEFDYFKSDNKMLDEYDNTIRYGDHLQQQVINLVNEYNAKYLFFADHGLGHPEGKIALKHDVRDKVDLNSLKVPFFLYPKSDVLAEYEAKDTISMYYFECIFSKWSGINAKELLEKDYCKSTIESEEIQFLDSNLILNKVKPQFR